MGSCPQRETWPILLLKCTTSRIWTRRIGSDASWRYSQAWTAEYNFSAIHIRPVSDGASCPQPDPVHNRILSTTVSDGASCPQPDPVHNRILSTTVSDGASCPQPDNPTTFLLRCAALRMWTRPTVGQTRRGPTHRTGRLKYNFPPIIQGS
jgi:hypothetical protein